MSAKCQPYLWGLTLVSCQLPWLHNLDTSMENASISYQFMYAQDGMKHYYQKSNYQLWIVPCFWHFIVYYHHRQWNIIDLCSMFTIIPLQLFINTVLILGLHPANERRCYFVTASLIGWAQAHNQPCKYMVMGLVDVFLCLTVYCTSC